MVYIVTGFLSSVGYIKVFPKVYRNDKKYKQYGVKVWGKMLRFPICNIGQFILITSLVVWNVSEKEVDALTEENNTYRLPNSMADMGEA